MIFYKKVVFIILLLFIVKIFAEDEIIPFFNYEMLTSRIGSNNSDDLYNSALLVHTANRVGLTNEEKNYGWGKIDTRSIAEFKSVSVPGKEVQDFVSFNKTHFLSYRKTGNGAIVATLAWDKKLNQDLDIRVINNGKASFPISLDKNGNVSTIRDNSTLTIERVDLTSKVSGEFTIQVTAKNRPRNDIPFLLLVSGAEFSEKITKRNERYNELKQNEILREERIIEYLNKTGESRSVKLDNGGKRVIYDVVDGKPLYKSTCNYNAAMSNGVNLVQSGGGLNLNLTGENLLSPIVVWDGGNALRTHVEFEGRVTYGENVGAEEHGTHVAGTIMAAGRQQNARGMAYKAEVISYDFNNDESEMSYEAENGCILSNHSYMSGQFSSYGRSWDIIANNNPYYSIIKAAANKGPNYNTMPINSNSKNVLTVGSGNDQPNGYVGPNISVSSFSSRGPTPDGRIKPDFIANGAQLYSTSNSSTNGYTSMSGTSMACPSATGAAALIQEYYYLTHGNVYMMSSTLKALIINSADEVANDGPDYNSGYGYINAGSACEIIIDNDSGVGSLINEMTLNNGETYEIEVVPVPGEDVAVTLCWNDPAAASSSGTNSKLVNDLDLRINGNGITYMPWKCNPNSPSSAATKGDNSADNVEKIQIENPSSKLTVSVSHKGILPKGQSYSLVMSGVIVNKDPFISVKSPVEDDVLEQYSQMEISWISNIDDNVSIDLYEGHLPLETLASNVENSGSLLWDIPEDFKIGSNFKIKVSSVIIDTLFDFSEEFSIVEEQIITTLPYNEDFDTLDTGTIILPKGYSQSDDDDIDWIVLSGPTPSKVGISPDITGPDGDNTSGNGNYIYIEASNPNNPGKTAAFKSPKFTLNGANKPILIFNYHMFSDTGAMGSLTLNIESDGIKSEKVIELNDNDYGDEWHCDTLDLTEYEGKRVSFTFSGTTGELWASDICIDDISVINTDIVSNVKLLDDSDKRVKGFIVGPNPCKVNKNVHFEFTAIDENVEYGELKIFDLVGNKLYQNRVDYCEIGKKYPIGKWNLKNFRGLSVSKGTYLAQFTVRTVMGEVYRIQRYIGIN